MSNKYLPSNIQIKAKVRRTLVTSMTFANLYLSQVLNLTLHLMLSFLALLDFCSEEGRKRVFMLRGHLRIPVGSQNLQDS